MGNESRYAQGVARNVREFRDSIACAARGSLKPTLGIGLEPSLDCRVSRKKRKKEKEEKKERKETTNDSKLSWLDRLARNRGLAAINAINICCWIVSRNASFFLTRELVLLRSARASASFRFLSLPPLSPSLGDAEVTIAEIYRRVNFDKWIHYFVINSSYTGARVHERTGTACLFSENFSVKRTGWSFIAGDTGEDKCDYWQVQMSLTFTH